jgi:hypothetical protein
MIRIRIDSKACYWSDLNNAPNWDDVHLISELSESDIVAECIFSRDGIYQVIYRGKIFWITDQLNIKENHYVD